MPDRTGKSEVAPKPIDAEFIKSNDYDKPVQHKPKRFFSVPTLRELEKKQRASEMIKAEAEYKNRGKYNGRN